MGWLAALVELLRGLWLWCFSPRLTLDGGMVVYRGAWLAEGGFSTVYTGADAASGRPLALKFVRVGDREQHDAALREVRAHRRVDDAHVLELLDAAVLQLRGPAWFGPTAQFAVLAFPRMTLGSLRSLIDVLVLRRDEGTYWDCGELVRVFEGVCRGVAAMHAAGMAHRDVKPDNVLLDGPPDAPRAVLMDLGSTAPIHVAVETRRDALAVQDEAACNSTMTYRAPELWQPIVGSAVTGAADAWSLGCLLWAMGWGYSPFEADFIGALKLPRVVECTHLRVLSVPPPPPAPRLPPGDSPRDGAAFYAGVEGLARSLFHADASQRPTLETTLVRLSVLRSGAVDNA